jgi:hypothetical protein
MVSRFETQIVDRLWSHFPKQGARLVNAAPARLRRMRPFDLLAYQSTFVRPGQTFHCWWHRKPVPGNLGDLLTPIILSRLFNVAPIFCHSRPFLGVGSIIQRARRGSVIWGAGLLHPNASAHPDAEYLAVRGPLTRDILMGRGRRVPAVFGDPALLMPLIYRPDVSVRYHLGVIPHYQHAPHYMRSGAPTGVKRIDVMVGTTAEVFQRIDDIASCEVIASSSLHGLILALAYGRKVVWLRHLDSRLAGDRFKFDDFFASVGLEGVEPVDITLNDRIDTTLARHAITAAVPENFAQALIATFRARYPATSASCAKSIGSKTNVGGPIAQVDGPAAAG